MRKASLIPGLNNLQLVKVTISDIGVISTVKHAISGLFFADWDIIYDSRHEDAVYAALKALGKMRLEAKKDKKVLPAGLCYEAFGHRVQVDIFNKEF